MNKMMKLLIDADTNQFNNDVDCEESMEAEWSERHTPDWIKPFIPKEEDPSVDYYEESKLRKG